jgi:hypothetical protein
MTILHVKYVESLNLIYTTKNKGKRLSRLFIRLRIASAITCHYFTVLLSCAQGYKTFVLSHFREDSLVSQDSSNGYDIFMSNVELLICFLLQITYLKETLLQIENYFTVGALFKGILKSFCIYIYKGHWLCSPLEF